MKQRQTDTSYNPELLRARAASFAASPRTQAAMHVALTDRKAGLKALQNPIAFFASNGAKIPPGFTIEVFERPPRSLPGPDWFPFVLEFFNCRTYWVRVCDDSTPPRCTWQEESVCLGFRLRPQFLPPRAAG
jgi:hypothetical protein